MNLTARPERASVRRKSGEQDPHLPRHHRAQNPNSHTRRWAQAREGRRLLTLADSQPARTHRLSDMSTATCSWPFRQPVPQFQSHQRDLEATVTSDAAARQMNRTPRCVEDRAIAERCLSAVVRRRPCEVSGTKSVLPQIQCVLDVKPLKVRLPSAL